jgi:hypothetical protein
VVVGCVVVIGASVGAGAVAVVGPGGLDSLIVGVELHAASVAAHTMVRSPPSRFMARDCTATL